MFYCAFGFVVEICTLVFELAPCRVEEVLAKLWVSEQAGLDVALVGGADVHHMLLSAMGDELAESRLVKLTNCFNYYVFCF